MTDRELLWKVCDRFLLASQCLTAAAARQDLQQSAEKIAAFCVGLEELLNEVKNAYQNAEHQHGLSGIGSGYPLGFDPDQTV